jgi:hypothetical protein
MHVFGFLWQYVRVIICVATGLLEGDQSDFAQLQTQNRPPGIERADDDDFICEHACGTCSSNPAW